MSKPSQATLLLGFLSDVDLVLFHTPDQEAFVTVPMGTHRETWPLRSGAFRRWLGRIYYNATAGAPGAQALQDALAVLEGTALFGGFECEVHLRLAEHEEAIYVDLGDEHWQAVKITTSGWEIVDDPPVRFRRPRGMRALPYPETGELAELREFVNVSDSDWPLLAAFAVAALRPRGPFPVMPIHGEQGSAKSTTVRMLKELIDPNKAPLRSEPRDGRDLMIAARNGWMLAFDNVSALPLWLSDAICRLATGGGFATRELHTDTDEVLIDVQRPVILNGIEELATRGDLLDRSVVLYLPQITRYRPEDRLWPAFNEARPRLLGGLLDAVAAALTNIGRVELARPPRMVDFAKLAIAAEPALGVPEGSFLTAYEGNRADANELTLEASLIAAPVRALAENGFVGTATELLSGLRECVSEETAKQRKWPKDATRLSGALRRIAPNLRAIGIEVTFHGDRSREERRLIEIRTVRGSSVSSVTSVIDLSDEGMGDARDAADAEIANRSRDLDGPDGHEVERLAELAREAIGAEGHA